MEKRLILFLLLSFAIFYGSAYLLNRLSPPPPKPAQSQPPVAATSPSVTPAASAATAAPSSAAPSSAAAAQAPVAPPTQADLREITVKTDLWVARLSNQGAMITEWTMTRFTDGKAIDPPQGAVLLPRNLTQEIGGPFRFLIPSDAALEKELNSARYEIQNLPESELALGKGEKREIRFVYANGGVDAAKTIVFKGAGADGASGFDFDFQASVKRNGNPVDAFVLVGPNFGDQNVTHVDIYKHAPQLSYAIGDDVTRESADALKEMTTPAGTPAPASWVAVDDNYFALIFIPARPSPAIRMLHNGKYVSIGAALAHGELNRVYAGPKDIETLSVVSTRFSVEKTGAHLEDIVSYGWLDWVKGAVRPIAQFMLRVLRAINGVTNNFGWSIVIFTILLNMLFFPLRWKSSKAMKRAAEMQPQMKALQDEMKGLSKDDPKMVDLQKRQIALMKEGNPLMGCLPLLLQMPFFMAFFAILTVSIEVRHAPFFGWLKDLSVADPFYILPLLMCVTMMAQTALTPSAADPVQKKVQLLMPVILTVAFFRTAPAGLVLYWMVSNLVGVAQQYVINKMNPPKQPATPAAPPGKSDQKPGARPPKGRKAKAALAN
jgi:YidC/Oxa1 family membrane protein insertase